MPQWILHLKKVREIVKVLEGSLVLDAGCGDGWVASYVQKHGHDVVACDFLKKQLMKSRKNTDAPLVLASLTHLPFRERSYGSIMCLDVLEHIPTVNLVLKEFHRILKTNGQLCVTIPGWLHGVVYDYILLRLPFVTDELLKKANLSLGTGLGEPHVHQMTYGMFAGLLREAGFKILQSWNLAILGNYLNALRKVFKTLLHSSLVNFVFKIIYADVENAHLLPRWLGTSWIILMKKTTEVMKT